MNSTRSNASKPTWCDVKPFGRNPDLFAAIDEADKADLHYEATRAASLKEPPNFTAGFVMMPARSSDRPAVCRSSDWLRVRYYLRLPIGRSIQWSR